MKLTREQREWAFIRRAAGKDGHLSDLFKARDLLFDAGLGHAVDAVTAAARRYYRANKADFQRG